MIFCVGLARVTPCIHRECAPRYSRGRTCLIHTDRRSGTSRWWWCEYALFSTRGLQGTERVVVVVVTHRIDSIHFV